MLTSNRGELFGGFVGEFIDEEFIGGLDVAYLLQVNISPPDSLRFNKIKNKI